MPYRFNATRRHRISQARYRVQNWPEYDRAPQRRGSLTVWVTPEALAAWQPPRTGRRGRPRDYSDAAIETGHLLRLAFGRPWRQTEGLLRWHRQLVELRLRWCVTGTACSWLRRSGDAGDLGPSLEGLAPGGSILGGGHLMAAKVEEVADPIVGGQEALRLAG